MSNYIAFTEDGPREFEDQITFYNAWPGIGTLVYSRRSRTWYELTNQGMSHTDQDKVPQAHKAMALLLT